MEKIAKEFNQKYADKTPAFIYDLDILKEHLLEIRQICLTHKLCYAMKANPLLVEFIEPFVDRIEVCSQGEFEICKAYKIPAHKIFYTGINKNKQDLIEAWKYGVRHFNAESLNQLEMLANLGDEVRIYPRVSSAQFGIDEEHFDEIMVKYGCFIAGLHYFGGTNRNKKLDFDRKRLKDFLTRYNFNELEYGVGLGVKYFIGDDIKSDKQRLEELNEMLFDFKLPICIELGRFIVAKCGLYASRICDLKQNGGVNYAILDGGINHLNYFGQIMGMKVPIVYHFSKQNDKKLWCLCGPICSMSDVLVRQIELSGLNIEDLIFFANTGAYSASESPALFLSRALPRVYLHKNNKFMLARDEIQTYKLNIKG